MLLTIFSSYCKLGPTTEADSFSGRGSSASARFVAVRPARASGLSKVGAVALGATARLYGRHAVEPAQVSQPSRFIEALCVSQRHCPSLVLTPTARHCRPLLSPAQTDSASARRDCFAGRPAAAISLEQLRQLVIDCKVLGPGCRMSDVGRLFALSGRPVTTPSVVGARGAAEPEPEPEPEPEAAGLSSARRRRRRGDGDGGESFPRVDWVAVPEALRARRVNRWRRGWPSRDGGPGAAAGGAARRARAALRARPGPALLHLRLPRVSDTPATAPC
jgi:hypothetical protein